MRLEARRASPAGAWVACTEAPGPTAVEAHARDRPAGGCVLEGSCRAPEPSKSNCPRGPPEAKKLDEEAGVATTRPAHGGPVSTAPPRVQRVGREEGSWRSASAFCARGAMHVCARVRFVRRLWLVARIGGRARPRRRRRSLARRFGPSALLVRVMPIQSPFCSARLLSGLPEPAPAGRGECGPSTAP